MLQHPAVSEPLFFTGSALQCIWVLDSSVKLVPSGLCFFTQFSSVQRWIACLNMFHYLSNLGSVYASAIISLSCVMDLLYPAIPDHLFASGHWKIMLIWPGVNLQIRTTFWHCGLKPECAELSRPEVSRKICKFSWAAALDCLNHIKSC